MIAPLVHSKKLAAYRLEQFEIPMVAIHALTKRLGLSAKKPKRKTSKTKTPCATTQGVLVLLSTKDAPGNRPRLNRQKHRRTVSPTQPQITPMGSPPVAIF